ncbi:hypothetical protein LQ564_04770 [Massilia sp. G4R7]|uniref:Dinitrogenase iron-molybdenum cofactor biosynthesis domain-containing protein n=1 Tax=Massilia phyllostachyos TaxID=2898585 RepID=A0ABS8Q1K3_9BURK|nr:hypothetical protein [Massilia phyllostachyos]MCD2515621.1 hypothetical protein [Massilia phyllostachyos]
METLLAERRASPSPASGHPRPLDTERIVRQAVLLQGTIGTPGAVEFLKSNGVKSMVMGRVLSGGAIRREDAQTRDNPQAWD